MDFKYEELKNEVVSLQKKVKDLKKLVKQLINASTHEHNWDRTGEHEDQNVERKCNICGLHEAYVYPMIPYENRWENITTGKRIHEC